LVAADTSYRPTLHVLLFNMHTSNAKTQENSDNHGLTTTPCSRQGCPVVICSASREQVSLPTFSGRASLQARHRSHRYEKPAKAALLANCTRYIKLISHNPLPILSANVSHYTLLGLILRPSQMRCHQMQQGCETQGTTVA